MTMNLVETGNPNDMRWQARGKRNMAPTMTETVNGDRAQLEIQRHFWRARTRAGFFGSSVLTEYLDTITEYEVRAA